MIKHCCRIVWSIEEKKSKKPNVAKANQRELMLWSKCVVCESTKSKFIKKQKVDGLLSYLGLKKPIRKISLLGESLF